MMDVERGIRVAVDTGDVTLGSEKSIQSLKLGKGRLAVVAANSPKEILEDVEYYANLSEIPFIVYEGTSVDLGSVCGKPFTVATLIINDPGDSTILDVTMGQIFVSIKFNANEIRFIALFESMTGAMVKDCILDDENTKVTFVVKNGDMGLAIGKSGSTVTKVKKAVGRGVEIIEYNEDPAQFIKNILSPAELKSIKIVDRNDEKIAIVNTDSSNKRIAIGKNGVNIERAKLLAKRQHDINNIILK